MSESTPKKAYSKSLLEDDDEAFVYEEKDPDLKYRSMEDHAGTGITTSSMYATRRRAYLSSFGDIESDLEDSQSEQGTLSEWGRTLRMLSQKKMDKSSGYASNRMDESRLEVSFSGYHKARVDLYEGSNLDTPESENSRRKEESKTGMGRRTAIFFRWVVVCVIAVVCVIVAYGVHESSKWGIKANIWLTQYAYNSTGESWVSVVTFSSIGTLFAACAGILVWILNPTLIGGVNEILCALNGIVVKGSFGPRQFLAQALGLAFITASPMAVGREGPMLAVGGQSGAGVGSIFRKGVTTEA